MFRSIWMVYVGNNNVITFIIWHGAVKNHNKDIKMLEIMQYND